MFASKRCRGALTSWCATHARIHSCSTVSATSLRDRTPGADARGHVCTMASATKNPSDASNQPAVDPGGAGSGSGTAFIFQADACAFVQREVRPGPRDTRESRKRNEEGILTIVDAAV